MNRLALIIGWAGLLIIDGVVLPGLGLGRAGLGPMVFLAALLAGFGPTSWTIGWGTAFAVVTEIIIGTHVGALTAPWLIVAGLWCAVASAINVPRIPGRSSWRMLIPLAVAALGLWVALQISYWLIVKVFYNHVLGATLLAAMLYTPSVLLTVIIEIFCLLIWCMIIPSDTHA